MLKPTYRATLLLLLFCLLSQTHHIFAQKKSLEEVFVTLQANNEKLTTVFEQIEQLTDFRFSYNTAVINAKVRITISIQNQSLAAVLNEIGQAKNLAFKRISESIVVYPRSDSQPVYHDGSLKTSNLKEVAGKIIAQDDNSPLPGVNVMVKGTNMGTTTDAQGKFFIRMPENAVLQISSIGFKTQKVEPGNRSTITIVLEPDMAELEEIVVIGYGAVKKSDLTGAVASVSGEDLKSVAVASIDQGIQGRAPGVYVTSASGAPGGAVTVRIRGGNSINSGNEPLYVIDGFPIYSDNSQVMAPSTGYPTYAPPNALSFLNPNDIESIEVLKDASSTAIYGSRGANGVVLITTKRGSAGGSKIIYDAYLGMQQINHKIDLLNGQEWAAFHNKASELDNTPLVYNGVDFSLPEEIGAGTDWQEEIFRIAPVQNHQLSFVGGTEAVKYAVSLNYFDQQGIVLGSGYQRGTLRTNLDITPLNRLKFGTGLIYSYGINNIVQAESNNTGQKQGMIGSALFNTAYAPVYNENGDFFTYRDVPIDASYRFQDNPVALGKISKDRGITNRFLGNVFGEYALTDDLINKISLGADLLTGTRHTYFPIFTRIGDLNEGLASQGTRTLTSWLFENTLKYNKAFGNGHEIDVVSGFTYQQQINFSNQITNKQFINDILEDNNINVGAQPDAPFSNKSKWQLASWLGRINYTIADKYLFTLSGRADGSSRFGKGNKWAFFPSVAGAWRISDEPFLQNSSYLSFLKLRFSYGITGNTEIPVYQSLARLEVDNYTVNGSIATGITPRSIGNPDLRWETTSMLNVGLDAGIFENRFTFTANYYYNLTKGLLFNSGIPITSGFAYSFRNAGSLENKGLEIGVEADILAGIIKWNTSLNWAMNRNKILDIGESEPFNAANVSQGFNVSGTRVDVGLPIGAFWGAVSNGIYNTQEEIAEDPWANKNGLGYYRYKDLNGDGLFNAADNTMIGDPNPDFVWSWNNSITLKNFDFNLFVNAVQGADVFNPHYVWLASQRPSHSNLLKVTTEDTWSPENTDAVYGRATLGNNGTYEVSDRMVFNGSYLRVRNITVGYTFPVQRAYLESVRMYVSGQNLLTFSQYWGYDPEVNTFGQDNLNQGIDTNAYPKARTLMIGANIRF